MPKKTAISIIAIMLFQFALPGIAHGAAALIDDTFLNTNRIDVGKTSAFVDTLNGWVTLSKRNIANSIILYPDSYDITLINQDAVETYEYNGSGMELNTTRSINGGLAEPVSIAGRAGEYVVLDRGTKTACWYHYDGIGMVQNGILSISALNDPRAIDVFSGTYDFALLDRGHVKWYSYDGTGLAPNGYLSLSTGSSSNPLSLSLEKGDYALIVLDKASKEIKYYYFNGNDMVLDTSKSIQTPGELNNPKSLSVSKDGGLYLVVDGSAVKAYNYDGSSMVFNSFLSLAGLVNPLAVAIKPESYDYAVLNEELGSPTVKYFAFNGAGMVEITNLEITGLDDIPYGNDQLLMGKAVTTGQAVSGLKLVADVEQPEGTNITWEVTVDGTTWRPVTPGGNRVKFSSCGLQPNYRAVLQTNDNYVTPKILSVQLTDASLSIAGHSDKSCYKAGEAMILSAVTEGAADSVEAVMWWTGGNGFTSGTATWLIPDNPITSDVNAWQTRHNYPGNYDKVVIIPKDMPDGDYTVQFRACQGINQAIDTISVQVAGSQFNRIMSEIDNQEYVPYE